MLHQNDAYPVGKSITQADLPHGIKTKISTVPCDGATLHTDNYKQDTNATPCKIFQALYLCLTWRVITYGHICIYMNRLHIYSICDKKAKYSV